MKTKKRLRFHHRTRRAPPGTAPGTLVIDPEAPHPEIRVMSYGPDAFSEETIEDPSRIQDFLHRESVTWVNVDGLGNVDVLRKIGEIFDVHQLALEDVVNVHQRPKVEEYGGALFMIARMPTPGEHLDSEQLSLFLGKDFLLTFQEKPGDCLEPVRDRLRKGRTKIRSRGADYLAYALLDAVVDAYFPILEEYGERLEAIETEILKHPEQEEIPRLHHLKREFLTLRRAIWPLREVFTTLTREEIPIIGEETRVYFRDCYDHTIQLMDVVETYRDFSSGLMDFYLSSVSNRMNEVMKVLTIIATIFIPLSFIAGLYGMNFNAERSPWNMPELNWYFGYPFALGLMVLIGVVLLIFFWKKGWLR